MAIDSKTAANAPTPLRPEGRAHHQDGEGAAEPAGLEAECGLHLELLGRLLQRRRGGRAGDAAAKGPGGERWDADRALRQELRRSSEALSRALLGRPCGGGEDLGSACSGVGAGTAASLTVSTEGVDHELSSGGDSGSIGNCDQQIVQVLSPALSTDGRMSGGHDSPHDSLAVHDSGLESFVAALDSGHESFVAVHDSGHESFAGHDNWDRHERVIDQLRKRSTSKSSKQESKIIKRKTIKPPSAFYSLRWLMSRPLYELAWALLIICNLIVMIMEEEYKGMQRGYELGGIYAHYGSKEYTDKWWPGADDAFYNVECFFAVVFTLELLITFGYDVTCAYAAWPTHRTPFWKDPPDIVDLAVVVCSDVSLALGKTDAGVDIQLFRILRLARLLRLIRLLRKINHFDPLHLMTTAIRGSMGALMFSSLLLITVLTLFAMLLTNALRAAYLGENSPLELEKRQELFRYFGTYSRSMLSMFELALANWPTVTRFMVEELHECFGPVCVLWKLSIGLAVVGVINGVFIRETFSVAENDELIMIKSRMRQVLQHKDRMSRLFRLADKNSDGVLDRGEFRRVFEKPTIRTWLEAMDLRFDDADKLFALIAGSADDVINEEELTRGIAQLKGPARNADLLAFTHGLSLCEAGRPLG